MIRWAAGRPAVVWATSLSHARGRRLAFARLPLRDPSGRSNFPGSMITASWPGASAELVEAYVTSPMESAIQAVRDVKKVSSESNDGDPASRWTSRQGQRPDDPARHSGATGAVAGRPAGRRLVSPGGQLRPEELSEQSLLSYTVYGPTHPRRWPSLVEEQITPAISSVEGVAGVNSGTPAEIVVSVAYDGQRLRQLGIHRPDRERDPQCPRGRVGG
jgi:multidrug efflux pump subunit AcrB